MNENKNKTFRNYRPGGEKLLSQHNIDGFDPNNFLVKFTDNDENGNPVETLYLPTDVATRWFRTVYPRAAMVPAITEKTDRKATAMVSLYYDVNDAKPAAVGIASREYTEDFHGKFFCQNAVTAAMRKALDYLGFGTPLDAHETEYTQTVTKPELPEQGEPGVIIVPRPVLPVQSTAQASTETDANAAAEKPKRTYRRTKKSGNIDNATAMNGEQPAPAAPVSSAAPPVEAPAPAPNKAPASAFKGDLPTLEEAMNFKIPYGALAGTTIAEAANLKGNRFIRYHCDRMRRQHDESDFAKATQIFCEFNAC